MAELAFDLLLVAALLGVAGTALLGADLFRSVVLFIVFGLLMSLAWMRLAAPDIALAEAAIGAGLTGALLLDAVGRMRPPSPDPSPARREGSTAERESRAEESPLSRLRERGSGGEGVVRGVAAIAAIAVVAGLGYVVLGLPRVPGGLTGDVAARLAESGVEHPVTAVLLNFRGYDTWLEVGVLLTAVLGMLILRRAHDLTGVRLAPAGDALLARVARWLAPLMVLVGGYLLWLGTHAPGGAFQAGAVLAAAAVLLLLAGHPSVTLLRGARLRLLLAAGFAAFLLLALALPLGGRLVLAYPPEAAGMLILLVEAAVTLSIAVTLAALFALARPAARG